MGAECCVPSDAAFKEEKIAAQIATRGAKWTQNKNSRICIIGAGPAGIHMASLLKKQGFEYVTILEKNPKQLTESEQKSEKLDWTERGKSVTIYDEEYECVHEVGTCYTHPKYDEIRKLLKDYDPENVEIPYPAKERSMIVRETYDKGVLSDFQDHKTKLKEMSWEEWKQEEVENLTIPDVLKWLPDQLAYLSIYEAARRYIKLHKDIFGDYDDENRSNGHYYTDSIQFPPKPNPKEDINKTFLQWMLDNDLRALIPNFIYNQAVQGIYILTISIVI